MVLEYKDVTITYKTSIGDVYAVTKASLKIEKGKIIGLVGESGAGKSTLAYSTLRLLPRNAMITEGSIYFQGKDILKLSIKELRKIRWSEISIIFQGAMNSLDPTKRVGDQISEVILVHKKMDKKEVYKRVIELLEKVNLDKERYYQYPHELSGGTKQRIMIAMALALKPKLLIADEPTTGLDVATQLQILNLIKSLRKEYNLSVLFVTHDLNIAKYISDKIVVMYAGDIVEEAEKNKIFENPLHPYTKALIRTALPLKKDGRIQPLRGTMPRLIQNLPKGCRFADRCDLADDKCFAKEPPMLPIDSRRVKCHLYSSEEVKTQ